MSSLHLEYFSHSPRTARWQLVDLVRLPKEVFANNDNWGARLMMLIFWTHLPQTHACAWLSSVLGDRAYQEPNRYVDG